jgi:hypothetical protein
MTKPPPPRFSITLDVAIGADLAPDDRLTLALGTALQHITYHLALCGLRTITVARKTVVMHTDSEPDAGALQALEEVVAAYLTVQSGEGEAVKPGGRVTIGPAREPVLRDMPLAAARTEALVRLSEISIWLGTLDGNRFAPGHDPADCRDDADNLLRRIAGIEPLARASSEDE